MAAAPAPAPAWLDYAAALGRAIEAKLARPDLPAATRLHNALDASAQPAGAEAPALTLRVWLDEAGRIVRVASAPPDSVPPGTTDADLRELLLGLTAGRAPPADIPQPVTLRLRLALPS